MNPNIIPPHNTSRSMKSFLHTARTVKIAHPRNEIIVTQWCNRLAMESANTTTAAWREKKSAIIKKIPRSRVRELNFHVHERCDTNPRLFPVGRDHWKINDGSLETNARLFIAAPRIFARKDSRRAHAALCVARVVLIPWTRVCVLAWESCITREFAHYDQNGGCRASTMRRRRWVYHFRVAFDWGTGNVVEMWGAMNLGIGFVKKKIIMMVSLWWIEWKFLIK